MAADEITLLDARVERSIRDLVRWRLIFFLLLLAVPAGLYGLAERQARRLDALGEHGETTTATVRSVSRSGAATYVTYEYTAEGATHSWSVSQKDAPHAVGQTFPIIYLPAIPTFSRPTVDRARPTAEAAANRSFSRKAVLGGGTFLAVAAFACDFKLRRLRRRGRDELTDPRASRTRLAFAGAMFAPFLVLIFGGHARDALRRGESLWPVVLGALLSLSILGGTTFFVLRDGQAHAAARSARLLKWVAPIALGVAALRLVAWLVGWP
jgi:hypothetical protein